MGRLLLIGNSRWHWAEISEVAQRVWHAPAPPDPGERHDWSDLEAWACVGRLPEGLALPDSRRVDLARVPLRERPPWLGVDRALVGWRAWCRQAGPVLVADAGTCLSLTRIDGQGCFRGGRLSAGLALQLRSLGEATVALPEWTPRPGNQPLEGADERAGRWPTETLPAMVEGCLRSCAATILQAWREVQVAAEGPEDPHPGLDDTPEFNPARTGPVRLWLTGGDALRLDPLLRQAGVEPVLAPELALEALAALAGRELVLA